MRLRYLLLLGLSSFLARCETNDTVPEAPPEKVENQDEESSSSSSKGNPFTDLLTPEHESYRSPEDELEDLYCSEVVRYFPGYYCAQEAFFGEGGNGLTFIVNDGTEREFMLKAQKDRSDRGFKALMDVQGHRNIIEVIKAEYVGKHLLPIIEFADFGNLKSYMGKQKARFANDTFVLDIFSQILEGIAHVHAHDIVHADIKLGNIVVAKDHVPKIIDFDLCVRGDEKKGGRGTSQYMAPEVYAVWAESKRHYNGKEDVYSLAIMLYYMFNRNFPFHASGRKRVLGLMEKKTFLLKAGTRVDLLHIYDRSLRWENENRAELKEIRELVAQAMQPVTHRPRVRYDTTISTNKENVVIEEMGLVSGFGEEIWAGALAVLAWLLVAGVLWYQSTKGKSVRRTIKAKGKRKVAKDLI